MLKVFGGNCCDFLFALLPVRSILIVLGLNDTLTLVGHFVSSTREREKRDRKDSRRDVRGTAKKEGKE